MASQQHDQVAPAEDVRGHFDAVLLRDRESELYQLLCAQSDTVLDTGSFSRVNFLAGPSTATPSPPPSYGVFSANTDTHTAPSSCPPSDKGKGTKKKADLLSIEATKGSITDGASAAGSGSDTDQTGPIALKGTGSHLDQDQAKKVLSRDKKDYKVFIDNRGQRLDLGHTDTHVALRQPLPNQGLPSAAERDIERDDETLHKSSATVQSLSYRSRIMSMLLVCTLLAILSSLLFVLVRSDGQSSESIFTALAVLLAFSVAGLPVAVVRTHGENTRAARCVFSIGMAMVACMVSLLALSIGRSATECYSVLVVVLTFSILLRGELDVLLT